MKQKTNPSPVRKLLNYQIFPWSSHDLPIDWVKSAIHRLRAPMTYVGTSKDTPSLAMGDACDERKCWTQQSYISLCNNVYCMCIYIYFLFFYVKHMCVYIYNYIIYIYIHVCSHLFLCIHTVYKNKKCEARIPPHLLGHKETENLDHWRCPRKHGKTPKIPFFIIISPIWTCLIFLGKSQISSSCAHWGPSHHFLGFRDDCWP
jgi:hypothetical protein